MSYNKSKQIRNILRGIPAAAGIAIAKCFIYEKEIEEVNHEEITDIDEAISSLHEAIEKSKSELTKIFSLAVDKLGEKRAAIFEAQLMILDDPVLLETIEKRIEKERKTPEFIVDDEISKYTQLLRASKEAYMKERSHDIEDIKNRIIRNLKKKKWKSRIKSDVVVVANSLTPADTVLFARVNVRGFVTNMGGITSHAAIVARSLNIPAVVGLRDATEKIKNGDTIIIDGFHGEVILNPTEIQISYYKAKLEQLYKIEEELKQLKDVEAETEDGRKITIMANLDLMDELVFAKKNGAKGIGLVRTEQIFQETETFPSEEAQATVYSKLADEMYPNSITIRAFDIGGDKVLPFDVKEPNPMLGWRGVRFLLDNADLFKTQLKAILRASSKKNVKVMIPMISSIKEIRESKNVLEECKDELRKEGIEFDENIPFGIMIEVPSAAVLVREFSQEVDFISIGTNDLIQYLLAVDRGNDIVSDQYQEFHPAIIRTLSIIIKSAKETGTCVSMCGEMAADRLAIPLLVGLGLDSVSVSPATIPYIKRIIRGVTFKEVEELVNECMKLCTEEEIKTKIYNFYLHKFVDDVDKVL